MPQPPKLECTPPEKGLGHQSKLLGYDASRPLWVVDIDESLSETQWGGGHLEVKCSKNGSSMWTLVSCRLHAPINFPNCRRALSLPATGLRQVHRELLSCHIATCPHVLPSQPLVDAAFQHCIHTADTFLFGSHHLLWHEAFQSAINALCCLQPVFLSCVGA